MKMGEHHGRVQQLDDKPRAVCSCGWSSEPKEYQGDAAIALHDHIEQFRSTGDEGGQAL